MTWVEDLMRIKIVPTSYEKNKKLREEMKELIRKGRILTMSFKIFDWLFKSNLRSNWSLKETHLYLHKILQRIQERLHLYKKKEKKNILFFYSSSKSLFPWDSLFFIFLFYGFETRWFPSIQVYIFFWRNLLGISQLSISWLMSSKHIFSLKCFKFDFFFIKFHKLVWWF